MNNFKNTEIYKTIIKHKLPCFFVSPHLDDAIFSAGGLLYELSKRNVPITVINVFTKASNPPYTVSIKKFLKSCGYKNAYDLYNDRIEEDTEVLNKIGVKVINLDFVDALWRQKKTIKNIITNLIPEFNYIYPIYRTSIAKGKISKNDKGLEKSLENKFQKIILKNKKAIVFGPAGIGNHTDHLIVRNALSENIKDSIVYWADYPYAEHSQVDKKFSSSLNLSKFTFKSNSKKKMELVLGYKSQISAIFGNNKIDTSKEIFFKTI